MVAGMCQPLGSNLSTTTTKIMLKIMLTQLRLLLTVSQKETCRGRQTFVLVPNLAGNSGTEVAHESTSGCPSHLRLLQLLMGFSSGKVTAERLRSHWEAVLGPAVPALLWCRCSVLLCSSHHWACSCHIRLLEKPLGNRTL